LKKIFTFFLDEKSNKKIKPQYFYPKNHRKDFSIATPAARAPHSTRGSLPSPKAEILAVIFWSKSIRAGGHLNPDVTFGTSVRVIPIFDRDRIENHLENQSFSIHFWLISSRCLFTTFEPKTLEVTAE
jgi:hypothetical protein